MIDRPQNATTTTETTTSNQNNNDSDTATKRTKNITAIIKSRRNETLLKQACTAFQETQSPSLKLLLDRIERNEWLCYGDMLALSTTLWRVKPPGVGVPGGMPKKEFERQVLEMKLRRRKKMLITKLKEQMTAHNVIRKIKQKVYYPYFVIIIAPCVAIIYLLLYIGRGHRVTIKKQVKS